MKIHCIAYALAAALATTAASLASTAHLDGKLPMYPHATPNAKMSDIPASALAAGVPYVLETKDSVATVDAWYASNAKGCTRHAESGAVQYKCDGGSIQIYVHGDTEIALVPAFHF